MISVYYFQVSPPPSDRLRFRDYNGDLTINSMMMCDAFGIITYCSSSSAGNIHDQAVLGNYLHSLHTHII